MKRLFKRLLKKKDKKRLLLLGSFSLVILLLILIFTSNILLEIHYILGNDVLIDLEVDNEYFTLVNGEMKEVSFTSLVKTNPFCEATCSYSFKDLSYNTLIEENSFELKALTPVKKTFAIGAPTTGTGSKLYRFTMQCSNKRTFFCKTSEEPTERNLLITVDYDLSISERMKKDKAKQEIVSTQNAILHYYHEIQNILTTEKQIQTVLVSNESKNLINETNNVVQEYDLLINSSWIKQEYDQSTKEFIAFENTIKAKENNLTIIKAKLLDTISRYNELIKQINEILWFDSKPYFLNESLKQNFSVDINELQQNISILSNRTTIEEKETKLLPIIFSLKTDINRIKEYHNKTIVELLNTTRELELLYCSIENIEPSSCFISKEFNTKKDVCSRLEQLKTDFYAVNNSWVTQVSTNDKTIIFPTICSETSAEIDTENNLTKANLTKTSSINFRLPKLSTYSYITIDNPDFAFIMPEPESQCCVFNSCKPCCSDKSCSVTPIIFLHGHAFSEEMSPDINLDGFNAIQNKLEKDDGIINAGRISLYNYISLPQNIWGKFGVPFSIKASYYYDIYRHSDSNVIVKTNNEGIDTYAVRFKEIVDKILFKMNADKAVIVAHSMGGLVTRRYLQIFGTKQTKEAILIATPNNGTYGIVSKLCSVFGSKLECRDLNSGSLFLNKLNSEPLPSIPFSMFVGEGCNMQNENGDGVVLVKSAKLPGAQEYHFNGTCDGTKVFHTEMIRDLKTYPEVYSTLEKIISKAIS